MTSTITPETSFPKLVDQFDFHGILTDAGCSESWADALKQAASVWASYTEDLRQVLDGSAVVQGRSDWTVQERFVLACGIAMTHPNPAEATFHDYATSGICLGNVLGWMYQRQRDNLQTYIAETNWDEIIQQAGLDEYSGTLDDFKKFMSHLASGAGGQWNFLDELTPSNPQEASFDRMLVTLVNNCVGGALPLHNQADKEHVDGSVILQSHVTTGAGMMWLYHRAVIDGLIIV